MDTIGTSFEDHMDIERFLKLYINASVLASRKVYQYVNNPSLMEVDGTAVLLSERQKRMMSYLKENGKISLSEYVTQIDPDVSRATRDFDKLREYEYIEKKALGRSTYYILRKDIAN